MELLCKLGESILSKIGEKLVDFALSREDKNTFESLQNNMRALHAKALDIGKEIKKAELSGVKKRKREVENWLEQVQIIENELYTLGNEIQMEGFAREFFCGGWAAKLESRVHGLVEQSRHFGELVLDVNKIKGETLLTKGLVGKEFEENLEKILRFLLVDRVSSIGIYGMGGVGKTTLAKHINNRLLEQNQEQVIWITVSQRFTIAMLQDEIAKFLSLNLSDERNEDKKASRLNSVLSQRKNLVLIFDDMWECIDLKKLGDPISVDGCRLLITTRSQKVCHQIDCIEVIKVKTLKEDEAWDLFIATLRPKMHLTPEVQEIAKSMVGVCDGLPLGIITIAGSMKGETDIHVWSDAWAELRESIMGQEDMDKQVFKVFKHSFDRLDRREEKKNEYSKFQLCFLHCSLYPEDYRIDKEELIRKFILEEFLDKRESRKALFTQGHVILDKLVSVCLLEIVEHDKVKMHDLVRAMALKITEGRTKVIAGHNSLKEISIEEEWNKDLEKMSLMKSGIETIAEGVSPNCPKLSTIFLEHNSYLKFIPNSFFLHMRRLSILDLSWTRVKKLPKSISDMDNLKALLLRECEKLVYVPNLAKLKELRELDLTNTAIPKMPHGMKKLINLKFLSLERSNCATMLPRGFLLNFPHLQCLFLPYHVQAPVKEMVELKHLEEFRGKVQDIGDCYRLIKSKPSLAYDIRVGLDNKENVGYRRYNQVSFSSYDFNSWEDKDMTPLAQDIQHLTLASRMGSDFNSRDDKDTTPLTQDIQHLTLATCMGLNKCLEEDLSQLINPTSIISLRILNCERIECLLRTKPSSNKGATTYTSAFPQLPSPHAIFSSLSMLSISRCHQMKKLGLLASQLQNLKELYIGNNELMEEIMEVTEYIGGESGEVSVVSLPKLEHLFLKALPKLKSICNVTMVCGFIQYITIMECPELGKLPLVFGEPNFDCRPSALRHICLRRGEKEWWEKLELGHTSHHSLLQRFVVWRQ